MASANLGLYASNDHVVVRCAQLSDAQPLTDYFVTNASHLKPWEPTREAAFFELKGWQQRLLKLEELHRLALGYYCVITDPADQIVLGTISFSQLTRFPLHACHVGYSLAQQAQGQYIMTQALDLACQWLFKQQHIHRIMAAYMPANTRSEAVLKRVGFVQEGIAKDYLLIDGQWQDHILTSLINSEWQADLSRSVKPIVS